MTIEEAIAQLKDLRKDRETFLANDEPDSEFAKDIAAIDVTVKALEETAELKRLLRLAVEELEPAICNYCKYENEEHCEYERKLMGIENYACAFVFWKHAEEALKLIGDDENA